MATPLTVEELKARQTEIRQRLQEIDAEFAGQALPDDTRNEWNELNDEREANETLIGELEARHARIAELAADPEHREAGATFHTARPGATRGQDIWDLTTIRSSFSNPHEARQELHERARRAVEDAKFPHQHASRERAQEHVEHLLEHRDDERGVIAHRVLATGSPAYQRAFGKYLAGQTLTSEETKTLGNANDAIRAMSLTAANGGYAVPYVLDPSIVPTSNLSVNPYRAISRVEQITVDEWRGVTSAGITAAFAAEATESSDNSPTLAQPTISTEKAQAFVPYSIEIGMDWGSLLSEMATLLQDAKDDLEATKFTTGSGTNEPFGVLTGATTVVTAAGTASFAVADVYSLENALGPRFRPRAQLVANRAQYNRIRQFDTAGGASIFVQNLQLGLSNNVPTPGNLNASVLGYPANECSAMASVLTTGSLIATLGDWRYFCIVDRIGLNVDLIPHLFGASGRPTGQRGLYAYWRVGSKVLDANAFRVLKTG